MDGTRLETYAGYQALDVLTRLLQQMRAAHPTHGSFEAAEQHWWWRSARPTDAVPQLFWFDGDEPVAASILTDWRECVALDTHTLPHVTPELLATAIEAGLAHAAELGYDQLEFEVDPSDTVRHDVLSRAGFVRDRDGLAETWLHADDRPPVAPIADGYRLLLRSDHPGRPHHLAFIGGPEVTTRLEQTSLYRRDLDLFVVDETDEVAGYALFWFDPATRTGVVEPMRIHEAHQRRGLARHVLTAGIDHLVAAGAERIKICFEIDNPASGALYLSVGFQPVRQTAIYVRGTPATG
ncbi:MAG: GNAT family N-acetyltransferase [Ilumatobacter sp.]